jgi:hypothetical protein
MGKRSILGNVLRDRSLDAVGVRAFFKDKKAEV